MKTVGPGVREIRIRESGGAFRVIYLASVEDIVVVRHAFQKKTQQTPQKNIELAASRLRAWKGSSMEVQTFDDVFDALADTPAEAANMKARADLLSLLVERIKSWDLSQEAAAARLGITRPRLNDLLRGKLGKFSLDALVNLATAAGLVLEIRVAVAA